MAAMAAMAAAPAAAAPACSPSKLQLSAIDRAVREFSAEVDSVAEQLKRRAAASAGARTDDGARLHPTAFLEQLTASVSVPAGCLFVGHINTDMDSVGGAVGAAELYNGRACLAQPPAELNGEIMYAMEYAHTGVKPSWGADDVEAWAMAHSGRSIPGFGSSRLLNDEGSLVCIADIFGKSDSKIVLVDHSAPAQMVECLRRRLIEEGETSLLAGIIDHHALDENIFTKAPLFMDVRPWGSMSTIVAHSFLRSARSIPLDVARLLLCAIMSDTVNLTSPTTTLADRYIVPLLCRFCDEEDHNRLAQELFKAKTAWFLTLSAFECVRADQKDFVTEAADGSRCFKWGWATVEVNDAERLLRGKSKQLLLELFALKQDKLLDFVFLSVVNLKTKTSRILLCGNVEVSLARAAFKGCAVGRAQLGDNDDDYHILLRLGVNPDLTILDAGAMTSRKKQFKPYIDAALQAGWSTEGLGPSEALAVQPGSSIHRSADSPRLLTKTNASPMASQVISRTYSLEEECEIENNH